MEIFVPIIVEIIGALGIFAGVYYSNKKSAEESRDLFNYRIEKLEEKVDKHNNVIERTYRLEGRMEEAEHNIRDLKEAVK